MTDSKTDKYNDEIEDACMICEIQHGKDTKLIECRPCGMVICPGCLQSYGDICPGCGGPEGQRL